MRARSPPPAISMTRIAVVLFPSLSAVARPDAALSSLVAVGTGPKAERAACVASVRRCELLLARREYRLAGAPGAARVRSCVGSGRAALRHGRTRRTGDALVRRAAASPRSAHCPPRAPQPSAPDPHCNSILRCSTTGPRQSQSRTPPPPPHSRAGAHRSIGEGRGAPLTAARSRSAARSRKERVGAASGIARSAARVARRPSSRARHASQEATCACTRTVSRASSRPSRCADSASTSGSCLRRYRNNLFTRFTIARPYDEYGPYLYDATRRQVVPAVRGRAAACPARARCATSRYRPTSASPPRSPHTRSPGCHT